MTAGTGLRNITDPALTYTKLFSWPRLYVRGLLSAGPTEYVIFMYDSSSSSSSPSHPSPFLLLSNGPSGTIESTCTPRAHARAFTLKFAHLYETSVHTRVRACSTTVWKFNGSVHRRHWRGLLSFKYFSVSFLLFSFLFFFFFPLRRLNGVNKFRDFT